MERMSGMMEIPRSDYEHLIEREAFFHMAAETAPTLIWIAGTDARCKWFNQSWLTFRGRTMEQEVGNGWTEGVHPDDFDDCLKTYLDNFEKRTPFRMEYRLLRSDGEYRWVLDQGTPRYSEGGIFQGYIGCCFDTTDIQRAKQLQQDLSKRLAEIAAIVESSDDVIISKDLNGIITSWNAAAMRVFGYSAEEIVGSSILKLIPEHLHSDEPVIIERIRAGNRIEHFETVRLTRDGRLIDVSVTISPVKDEHGKVIGASKILRDISGRKRLEESLLQAEKIAATGRMAATIAHEINNPLEAVMNLLYLLRPMIASAVGVEYLNSAESELLRVSHIAKQTLGYYRENASASSASLAEITRQAISIYEPRCTAMGIQIHRSLESSKKIVLRRGEMMQVISNLIANSIYAMPTGGTLSISVRDRDDGPDGIVLSVEDNGLGIKNDDLPKVFDAFFTTRSAVGTGIGLFIAKQFIEGHGGEITIESNTGTEQHGTRVSVLLPTHTSYDEAPPLT
jgi:PAS domain S-box-containing protein